MGEHVRENLSRRNSESTKGVWCETESGAPFFNPCVPGKTNDGYHSFDELYAHRHALFIALANTHPEIAWKSKAHEDGSMYDGWFIAGMRLPEGQVRYHLPFDLWKLLAVPTLESAPKRDGHTSADTVDRLMSWSANGNPKDPTT